MARRRPLQPPGTRVQLKRALSKLGFCSRSTAQRAILEGRVRVNGGVSLDPLAWVDLARDRITLAGTSGNPGVPPPPRLVTLLLHKPPGYVTTRSDERGRPTVFDLLPESSGGRWLFPVGRLDRESEGLLLFTSDGPLADRLTDPEAHVPKVYRIMLEREMTAEERRRFERGVVLDGARTRPARMLPEGERWYRATIAEGRNRQLRRMLHALGHRVRRLVRVAIGGLELGGLPPGGWRLLEGEDLRKLFAPATTSPRPSGKASATRGSVGLRAGACRRRG